MITKKFRNLVNLKVPLDLTPIQEIKLGFVQRLKSGPNVLSEIVIHRRHKKIHFSLKCTMTHSVLDFKCSNQGFQVVWLSPVTQGFMASRHSKNIKRLLTFKF